MSLKFNPTDSTPPEAVPKRKKASAPKVRSGCKTLRRIKCDEGKPTCLKCSIYGRPCGGYSQDTENKAPKTSLLLPKQTYSANLPLVYSPGACPQESGQDWHYFEHYRDSTAFSVAGSYDPALWNNVVLQAAEQEPSLKRMLRALAALDLTPATTRGLYSWNFSGSADDPHEHHRYALREYGKALRETRDRVLQGQSNLRTSLIFSHLSIAIETFHGNFEPALAQVYNATRLLDDSGFTEKSYLESTSKPNPATGVEDELAQMFYALSFIAMTFTPDIIPVQVHLKRKNDHEETVAQMPSTFDSVRQAIFYMRVIARRCSHFQAASWMFDESQTGPPNPGAYLGFMDRVSNAVVPEAFEEQQKYLQDLERWNSAVAPLAQHSHTPAGREYRGAIALLQLHSVGTYINVSSALTADELFYDVLIPQFQSMVQLSREVYAFLPTAKYTLAFRAVAYLAMTARKCRDPVLRREAIQLLAATPRREMFWDSIVAAQIGLWVVSLEEEGMVDGFVPKTSRVRNIAMNIDMETRSIHVWCMQPRRGGEPGEWIRRETTLRADREESSSLEIPLR
ncbi:hypothetical protein BP6252_07186 [Coleophoma cylindrospora]|uniref:Zn(2)-C6 fungal-type domain-containing protein n=1 Tax=Coleophoma cylindrospora TaxID=1849047 RepID=A0A3D8RGV2_9HELO|nr:hypothetical protein BP6252_07186 [Coleophoma cylindrospora]